MAFPESVTTFLPAVDPTTSSDMQNINAYQQQLASGNFTEAHNILASMTDGIKMNINAGRYNEVMQVVEEIEAFYRNTVLGYINDNIDALSDINVWNNTTNYKVGNIASNNSQWFVCKAETGPDSIVMQPEVTIGWATYWDYFLQQQPAKQYPIQATQPTGQEVGDLWFQIVDA